MTTSEHHFEGMPYMLGLGLDLGIGDIAAVGILRDGPGHLGSSPYEIRVTGTWHAPIWWRVVRIGPLTTIEYRFADGFEGKCMVEHDQLDRPVVLHQALNHQMRTELRYAPRDNA